MPVRRYGALAFSLWLAACGVQVQNLEDNVFNVLGNDCRGRDLLQSGFRTTVDGEVGIVTTLHGVVGCRAVAAENATERGRGLEIAMVDVSRDVAFLSSDALRTDRSLRVSASPPSVAGADAVPIRDLATADQLAALTDRRSPRPEIVVFHRAGSSHHDNFGAPVLDGAGAIVGVENGVDGASGSLGWVVAYQGIEWTPPVQNEPEMDRLASLSSPLW